MAQAEKKVEFEINGKKIRAMPHMIRNFTKFGATIPRRITREPPRELLPLPKKLVLPRTEIKPAEVIKPMVVAEILKPAEEPVKVLEDIPGTTLSGTNYPSQESIPISTSTLDTIPVPIKVVKKAVKKKARK